MLNGIREKNKCNKGEQQKKYERKTKGNVQERERDYLDGAITHIWFAEFGYKYYSIIIFFLLFLVL